MKKPIVIKIEEWLERGPNVWAWSINCPEGCINIGYSNSVSNCNIQIAKALELWEKIIKEK